MSSSDSSPVMNAHRKQGQSQNPRRSNKMILQIYTIIHTLLSLIAIFTGFVVLFGLFAGKRLDGWTKWFLITAVATTVTGFFLSVSRNHARHQAWYHFVSRPLDDYLRALRKTSRRRVALDLCRRCRADFVFQRLRRGRAVI